VVVFVAVAGADVHVRAKKLTENLVKPAGADLQSVPMSHVGAWAYAIHPYERFKKKLLTKRTIY